MRTWPKCWPPKAITISLYSPVTPGTPTVPSNNKPFLRLWSMYGRGILSADQPGAKLPCHLIECLAGFCAVLVAVNPETPGAFQRAARDAGQSRMHDRGS